MSFKNILLESRVSDFKEKYQRKFGEKNTERILSMVSPKYLEWVGKNLNVMDFESAFPKLYNALKTFEKISSNLPITDLNQYKSSEQLISALNDYSSRVKRKYKEVQGGNLVYEDSKFYIVNPLTHESSCYYGSGTKWCTAASSDSQFKQYNVDGKLFYIIDKTLPSSDEFYKVALLKKFDGNKTYYDAKDDRINSGWILGTEELNKIEGAMDDYMTQQFTEQLKIFNDAELAKKEKERLRKLETARIEREKLNQAEDRRTEGEWELGPDCPDEGLMAHALLNYLSDNSEVEVLTNEDRIEMQRIKDEIERLNTEYDESEDTRTDLLDEIEELEDTLSELEEKIDVYNIAPLGGHYNMTMFEVLDAGLDGREYIVGDETDTEESAREAVESLIDDIGYEGFNKGFVMNYIDEDEVKEYARDMYENDVSDSPESYFDDSERELSDSQQNEIEELKMKISRYNSNIEMIQNEIRETEDEDEVEVLENKLEELESEVEDLRSEIEDIESDPQGDFPEDMIEEKIDDLVSDATYDTANFLSGYGLEWQNFINKDDFIQGVVDEDGFGHNLSSYDGNLDEIYVGDKMYYVGRYN